MPPPTCRQTGRRDKLREGAAHKFVLSVFLLYLNKRLKRRAVPIGMSERMFRSCLSNLIKRGLFEPRFAWGREANKAARLNLGSLGR